MDYSEINGPDAVPLLTQSRAGNKLLLPDRIINAVWQADASLRGEVMSKLHIYSLLVFCVLVSSTVSAANDGLDDYIQIFTDGNPQQQTQAAKELAWAGLSDPRLFDLIEKSLLDKYLTVENKYVVDDTAWLAKALAYSGQEQYRATLQKVASDSPQKKIKKHAQKSLAQLDNYARWNPIISDTSNWDSSKSDEVNRYANMLRSDDLELKRMGAKRVHNTHAYDPYLLDLLDTEIRASYLEANDDSLFIDTVAWMCKALSGSRVEKYKSTIVEVSENAGNKKVAKYATKYLKYYE
jgi:hypothetical protein